MAQRSGVFTPTLYQLTLVKRHVNFIYELSLLEDRLTQETGFLLIFPNLRLFYIPLLSMFC